MYHWRNSNGSKTKLTLVTKNDISLVKSPNLVGLVTRKKILNFKSFYVNKDGFREFITAHEEVSIINVRSCFKVEIFQYSNWKVSNSWEGKRRCIHSIISKRIIPKRNLTVTELLNLSDLRDILVNTYTLKACFYRSFNLNK